MEVLAPSRPPRGGAGRQAGTGQLRALSLLICLACALLVSSPTVAASIDALFTDWLKSDLWPEARARGVSAETFNAAFAGVKPNLDLPDLVMPGEKPSPPQQQHQAEFRSPAAYFAENVVGAVTAGGRTRARRFASTLSALEARYGVPGAILLAIWGRESGFGSAKLRYDAIEVLATKAFMSIRKDEFRPELLAALEMIQRGTPGSALKSSWAGALGQPQFLPGSYLKHAADGDGDGNADIWDSEADTLASIANYLKNNGWVAGRDWGFEVAVPASVPCSLEGPDRGRPISEWAARGIARVSGRPFPDHEARQQGFLLMPAGRHGPAFIVTPNFYVLKTYNESDLYALFVGHAADRIMYGDRRFSAGWGKLDSLHRSDIAAMQRGLEHLGHDVGGADGLPGYKTRRSVGEWQASRGLAPTCFPDATLVKALR